LTLIRGEIEIIVDDEFSCAHLAKRTMNINYIAVFFSLIKSSVNYDKMRRKKKLEYFFGGHLK